MAAPRDAINRNKQQVGDHAERNKGKIEEQIVVVTSGGNQDVGRFFNTAR